MSRKKRSNLVVNKRFQLKYTAMVVGLATIISVVLGTFLAAKIRENSRMISFEPGFDEALQAELARTDAQTIMTLIGALVLFNVLLAILGLFITHRIAGPIAVFSRYLEEIGEGKIPKVRPLRKRDEFEELREQIQKAAESLQARTEEHVAALGKVLEMLEDSTPDLDRARGALAEVIQRQKEPMQPGGTWDL